MYKFCFLLTMSPYLNAPTPPTVLIFFFESRDLCIARWNIYLYIYIVEANKKNSPHLFSGGNDLKKNPQNLNTSLSWKLRPDEMIDQVKFGVQLQKNKNKKTRGGWRAGVKCAEYKEENTQLRPHSTRPPSDIHPVLKAL